MTDSPWYRGGRFHNAYPVAERHFRVAREYARMPPPVALPLADIDHARLHDSAAKNRVMWLGHASFLLRIAGVNVLTDPVFSERCSPVQWLGPKRSTAVPLSVSELPRIDVVVISHNHYDHLDEDTVVHLAARFPAVQFVVPQRLATWFQRRGITAVTELAWWEAEAVCGLHVTAVPAQHFSGRHLTDRNATHWCGYILQSPDRAATCYFAGDTGYCPGFREIGARFAIDLSLLPIGAYQPRGIMKAVHVNPREAVQVHQDVGSKKSIGMHWGVFRLTTEPMDEPPRKLKEACAEAGIADDVFSVMRPGEMRDW